MLPVFKVDAGSNSITETSFSATGLCSVPLGTIRGKSIYEPQANQVNAKHLKGHLLITHGNMDDNVPASNTYLVVEALEKANKDFDLIIFPNAHHGYGEDTYYMMRRCWDYFVKNLMGATPPKEFVIKLTADMLR